MIRVLCTTLSVLALSQPLVTSPAAAKAVTQQQTYPVSYRTIAVDGVKVFYREAGDRKAPAILLLHGFPTSSAMFNELIPLLADRYHVIAPDYPGFGFSDMPAREQFTYNFENITKIIDGFTQAVGLQRYALYTFDYGAPIGFRLALAHPERVSAIISQNGNVYEEGLGQGFKGLLQLKPTDAGRAQLRSFGILSPNAVKAVYVRGAPDPTRIAPDLYTLDSALLARTGNDEVQYDLLLDYNSNVALYPQFQEYLRTRRPPLLAVWGKNDTIFAPAGAEAFKRDVPGAEVHLYDTGHFALSTHGQDIAQAIRSFLKRALK